MVPFDCGATEVPGGTVCMLPAVHLKKTERENLRAFLERIRKNSRFHSYFVDAR
jgi:hypothetical protein